MMESDMFFNICAKSLHQGLLIMGFPRQEYWSCLSCPPPRDRPDPGIEPTSLTSPALVGWFFMTSATWEVHVFNIGET